MKTICLSMFLCTVLAVPCVGQVDDDFPGRATLDVNELTIQEARGDVPLIRKGIVGGNPVTPFDFEDLRNLRREHKVTPGVPINRKGLALYRCEIIMVQIVDDNNALVKCKESWHIRSYTSSGKSIGSDPMESHTDVWVEASTEGMVDGQVNPYGKKPLSIVGTKRYTTGAGTTRTVPLARPPSDDEWQEMLYAKVEAKRAADTATKQAAEAAKAKLEAAKHRTWTSADGRSNVAAKYVSYIGGVVTLKRDDGKTVSLRMEQLSEDDQEFIRKRRWLEESATPEQSQTSRNRAMPASRFVGRWRLVNDKGVAAAYFTLTPSWGAKKDHVPDATATWEIVGNDARITWSDGWRDVLRAQEDETLVITFRPGTSWDDPPHNTLRAIRE